MNKISLNLYKCTNGDNEWYTLAKEICKGVMPIYCTDIKSPGGFYYIGELPPEKIEFMREVQLDLSELIDDEHKRLEKELADAKLLITNLQKDNRGLKEELEEYKPFLGRLYLK